MPEAQQQALGLHQASLVEEAILDSPAFKLLLKNQEAMEAEISSLKKDRDALLIAVGSKQTNMGEHMDHVLSLLREMKAVQTKQSSLARDTLLNNIMSLSITKQQKFLSEQLAGGVSRQEETAMHIRSLVEGAGGDQDGLPAPPAKKQKLVNTPADEVQHPSSGQPGLEDVRTAKREALALRRLAEQQKAKASAGAPTSPDPLNMVKTVIPGHNAEIQWSGKWQGSRSAMSDYTSLMEILEEWETGVKIVGTSKQTVPLMELEKAFAALGCSDKINCRGWRSGKSMRTRMLDMKRIIYYAQRVAAARGDEPRTVLQELEAECAAMPKSKKTLASRAEMAIKLRDGDRISNADHEVNFLKWGAADKDGPEDM